MALNCGIVGLPNVGKSTIFSALTSAPAEAANYPFCTIEPNIGIVAVNDERLKKISAIVNPQKITPATVEFVDIAGLVKGASQGEGLGNQFLGHIRQVHAIAHIVRCFDDDDIVHVSGKIDPLSDIEIINTELALADLEVVERRISNLEKQLKSHDKEIAKKAQIMRPMLGQLQEILAQGNFAKNLVLEPEELEIIKELQLITMRKVLYVCNVDESCLSQENEYVKQVRDYAANTGDQVLLVCGKLESEIAALDTIEERTEFMQSSGILESGLDQLIHSAYDILGLKTYFTAGPKEVRAWTFKQGMKAPETAGIIHSDFQRGFIKAEVYHCNDLFTFGSELKVKENGKLRIEGKEYLVVDGDIMHFRFNV